MRQLYGCCHGHIDYRLALPPEHRQGIGAFNGGSFTSADWTDCDIAELIVGAGTFPSAPDIDRIFGYLAHKWGLTGSLPSGHPYKTNPPIL